MSIRITQIHKKPELRYHFTLFSINLFSFSALPRTVNPCITPRFTTNLPLGTSDRSCKWQPRGQRTRNICPRWYIQHSSSFILLGIANSDINIKVSFQCMVHCRTQYTHVMMKCIRNENLIGSRHVSLSSMPNNSVIFSPLDIDPIGHRDFTAFIQAIFKQNYL